MLGDQIARNAHPAGITLLALFDGLSPELVACDPEELEDIETEDLESATDRCDPGFRLGGEVFAAGGEPSFKMKPQY